MTDNNGSENGRDNLGRFQPGNTGKPSGASKNKMRDKIKTFLNDNWEEFPLWFEELKPKEKIETMLSLLPYGVSRLQSISITNEEGNQIEPKGIIDYTRLKPEALNQILGATNNSMIGTLKICHRKNGMILIDRDLSDIDQDERLVTEDQFEKLRMLMPQIHWIFSTGDKLE